jgi:hypothetical protein
MPFPANSSNVSRRKPCKPKTSVFWYNWNVLSNFDTLQISFISISNNTPLWSLIPGKLLQDISEILDL